MGRIGTLADEESLTQGESAIKLRNDREIRLVALQLSTDHCTSIEEEVIRIKNEHPDDSQCIVKDRVKGRLKVTGAFGAGFLKQGDRRKYHDDVTVMVISLEGRIWKSSGKYL